MKYIITEHQNEKIILDYLDKYVEPDYSWGPDLHDFYREDVENYGSYDFVINDVESYRYTLDDDGNGYLEIFPNVHETLDSLFGPFWEDLFFEWFEKNSGLKIDRYHKLHSWEI
jgi:hypothetical protein